METQWHLQQHSSWKSRMVLQFQHKWENWVCFCVCIRHRKRETKCPPTCHHDWAALWPTAASCRPGRPRRRGSWTTTGQRGGEGGEAAGRPRWSPCRPAACWRSARAGSFLKERRVCFLIHLWHTDSLQNERNYCQMTCDGTKWCNFHVFLAQRHNRLRCCSVRTTGFWLENHIYFHLTDTTLTSSVSVMEP